MGLSEWVALFTRWANSSMVTSSVPPRLNTWPTVRSLLIPNRIPLTMSSTWLKHQVIVLGEGQLRGFAVHLRGRHDGHPLALLGRHFQQNLGPADIGRDGLN